MLGDENEMIDTLLIIISIWVMIFFIWAVIKENEIVDEKRKEMRKKRKDERQKKAKEREQSEKQTNDWVRDLRRRRIISKGPELNRIARSVFGDIGMFDVNEIDGKLSFRTDLGNFSINNALSRDYESILDELEFLKKRRENKLANKVSINTNLDSRSSNSKKYCFRRYAGCRNEAESGWRYRGRCKQCYQDYVESTDEDG